MRPLPRVLFQHFRAPQNQGSLLAPQGTGRVEGRRDDAWIVLYLGLARDGTLRASFELEGERSCLAPMSLLTTHVRGRPLEEVEALTLDDLGAAYGLDDEFLPGLVPAFEALQAALADLRGQPSPYTYDGPLVCHCLHVRRGRIERAIRERGLTTVEDLRRWTRACSGCRSCRPDLERLLARARRREE